MENAWNLFYASILCGYAAFLNVLIEFFFLNRNEDQNDECHKP